MQRRISYFAPKGAEYRGERLVCFSVHDHISRATLLTWQKFFACVNFVRIYLLFHANLRAVIFGELSRDTLSPNGGTLVPH